MNTQRQHHNPADGLRRVEHEGELCRVPLDVGKSGRFSQTACILVTRGRISVIEDGNETSSLQLESCEDFKVEALVGTAVLSATCENRPTVVARATMLRFDALSQLAIALNRMGAGAEFTFGEKERGSCPKCGKRYPERDSLVCPACVGKGAMLGRLLGLARPQWKLLGVAAALFWCISGIQILVPQAYRILIDRYLAPKNNDLPGVLFWIGLIGACSGATALFSMLRSYLMSKTGAELSQRLRTLVFSKIQMLSLHYLTKKKTGELMNRVTRDTQRIQDFIQSRAANGVNELLTLCLVSGLLFSRDWRLALLILFPAPLVLAVCYSIRLRIQRMYRKQNAIMDESNTILQEIFNGIRVIKVFGQESRMIDKFNKISRTLAGRTATNERAWNTLFPALGFFMGVGNFLVLIYGGHLVLGQKMKLGELVLYSQYAGLIYGPLNWISFFPRWFGEAMASAARFFEVVDEQPEVAEHPNAVSRPVAGHIVFDAVTFGYAAYLPVLKSISFEVKPGEMIGLVGRSGVGKSTVLNLLLRFYDTQSGRITVDGCDIREFSQHSLRSQLGVVLQETFLFSGTILDNIRYSKPGARPDEIIRVAKIANAHDFIMEFPDGYDTRVGEDGQRLSGGERQRIAIARALLHDPAVLILDEATASVDTETEQLIQEALARLVKGRTTFAIAHRLSTLRRADRLVVLDKGSVAESGTHEDLMKNRGIYFKLIMAQWQMSRVRGVDEQEKGTR